MSPFHEMLFIVEHQLCREFHALSPFDVENRPYHDVIKLYADVRKMQIDTARRNDPNRVIRRPASDDWF